MFSRNRMKEFTASCSGQIEQLKQALETADAVLIGAGSGLSTSAGLTYSGERFERYFSDFHQKYGITDIYSGGFYPFDTLEEYWAWWSRHIFYNRYVDAPLPVYQVLLALVKDKDYFVLTTNVDHQFQRSGFDKKRLFYTQGDYGLWQCSKACHCKTYDNENTVRQMVARQRAMRIPTELIPRCPVCGAPMTMNLRCDDTLPMFKTRVGMLPKAGIQTLYGGTSMRRCCIWSWVWETIRRLLSSIRSGNIRWKTQTLSMPV